MKTENEVSGTRSMLNVDVQIDRFCMQKWV